MKDELTHSQMLSSILNMSNTSLKVGFSELLQIIYEYLVHMLELNNI